MKEKYKTLTHEYVLNRLDYNPITGITIWKDGRRQGKEAGSYDSEGYKQIKINGFCYRLPIILWFYMTGSWPDADIDHINRIRDDNKWDNLRLSTKQDNVRNRGEFSNNTSGHTNIDKQTRNNGNNDYWRVSIKVDFDKVIRKYFPYNSGGLEDAIIWRDSQIIKYFNEQELH